MRLKGEIDGHGISGLDIQLDAAILELIRGEIIDGIDVEAVLAIFRPQPKVVSVDNIVERVVPQSKEFKKHYPVNIETAVCVETSVEKGV